MKICIFGSRTYSPTIAEIDMLPFWQVAPLVGITELVCGMARGVDCAALAWAKARGIQVREFHADWNRLGTGAGPARNRAMALYADAGIGFWNRESKGTANMTAHLVALRRRVLLIEVGR